MTYRPLWARSCVTSSSDVKTAPFHAKRASLASWLVTVVYAITISVASGEVATERSVMQPIASITLERRRCRLYQSFHDREHWQFP